MIYIFFIAIGAQLLLWPWLIWTIWTDNHYWYQRIAIAWLVTGFVGGVTALIRFWPLIWLQVK